MDSSREPYYSDMSLESSVPSLMEVQRIIGLSLTKIQAGRNQRGGLPLHKNLLVATVLNKARDVYMQETMVFNYKMAMSAGQFGMLHQAMAAHNSENCNVDEDSNSVAFVNTSAMMAAMHFHHQQQLQQQQQASTEQQQGMDTQQEMVQQQPALGQQPIGQQSLGQHSCVQQGQLQLPVAQHGQQHSVEQHASLPQPPGQQASLEQPQQHLQQEEQQSLLHQQEQLVGQESQQQQQEQVVSQQQEQQPEQQHDEEEEQPVEVGESEVMSSEQEEDAGDSQAVLNIQDEGFIDEPESSKEEIRAPPPFQYCCNCARFHPDRGPTLVASHTCEQAKEEKTSFTTLFDLDSQSTFNARVAKRRRRSLCNEEDGDQGDSNQTERPHKRRRRSLSQGQQEQPQEDNHSTNKSSDSASSECVHPAFRGGERGGMEIEQITSLVSIFSFGQHIMAAAAARAAEEASVSHDDSAIDLKHDNDSDDESDTSSDSGHSSEDHDHDHVKAADKENNDTNVANDQALVLVTDC